MKLFVREALLERLDLLRESELASSSRGELAKRSAPGREAAPLDGEGGRRRYHYNFFDCSEYKLWTSVSMVISGSSSQEIELRMSEGILWRRGFLSSVD